MHIRILLIMSSIFLMISSTNVQSANVDEGFRTALEAGLKAAIFGPAQNALNNQGIITLPKGYIFIPKNEAIQLFNSTGITDNQSALGLITAVDPDNFCDHFIIITYHNAGFMNDNDAKTLDINELLRSLKRATQETNRDMVSAGFEPGPEIHGWIEPPHYDEKTHTLFHAVDYSDEQNDDGFINYTAVILGREGYFVLAMSTTKKSFQNHSKYFKEIVDNITFNAGKQYSDFNAKTDRITDYGIAALITGVTAKKLGLFSVVFAFLAKYSKIIIIGGGAGLFGLVKRLKKAKEKFVKA